MSLNLSDDDFLIRNDIKYISVNKLDEQLIITNTENYFKSIIYKNLCKYSKLTKIKIEDIVYIPESFIDSYASWYSTIYYLNKLKIDKSEKIEKEQKIKETEEIETLKDILKCVITIKTDLAKIQEQKIIKTDLAKIQDKLPTLNEIKDKTKKISKTIVNKCEEVGEDFLNIPVKKENTSL